MEACTVERAASWQGTRNIRADSGYGFQSPTLWTEKLSVCVACRAESRRIGPASKVDSKSVPKTSDLPVHLLPLEKKEPTIQRSPAHKARKLRSTATDRGETTGAPGSVASRVSRGVEDGTGYDSDMEVGSVKFSHEQPWGGVDPAVQFVTEFLREELPKILTEEGCSTAVFSEDLHFSSPLMSLHGLRTFRLWVSSLRTFFAGGRFTLHSIAPTDRDEVTARWTSTLPARFMPWQPTVQVTGTSTFTVDLQQAKVTAFHESWDELDSKKNHPLSLAAFASVASQLQPLAALNRPQEGPYVVLRKTSHYEIRQYDNADAAARTVAIRRGDGDLLAALDRDGVKFDRSEMLVRRVKTGWPHGELRLLSVPVTFVPTIDAK